MAGASQRPIPRFDFFERRCGRKPQDFVRARHVPDEERAQSLILGLGYRELGGDDFEELLLGHVKHAVRTRDPQQALEDVCLEVRLVFEKARDAFGIKLVACGVLLGEVPQSLNENGFLGRHFDEAFEGFLFGEHGNAIGLGHLGCERHEGRGEGHAFSGRTGPHPIAEPHVIEGTGKACAPACLHPLWDRSRFPPQCHHFRLPASFVRLKPGRGIFGEAIDLLTPSRHAHGF